MAKKRPVVLRTKPIVLPLDADVIEPIRGLAIPWLTVEIAGDTLAEAVDRYVELRDELSSHYGGPTLELEDVE